MPVLAVDLDGTLIRSDMLHESFWSGFARDWRTPLHALAGLASGKAALKARLAALAPPDPATLPYIPEVLAHIRDWRARRGKLPFGRGLGVAGIRGARFSTMPSGLPKPCSRKARSANPWLTSR